LKHSDNSLLPRFTITQDEVRLSSRRPVRAQPMHVTVPVAPHDHHFYELCLVTDGSAQHRTAEDLRRVGRGHVIIVAPGQVHAFERVGRMGVVNVYYLSEWLLADLGSVWDHEHLVSLFLAHSLFPDAPRRAVVQFELEEADMAAARRELRDLAAEFDRASPSRIFLKSALSKLLVLLARAHARTEGGAGGGGPFAFRPEVRAVLTEIEAAVADAVPLDLPAVAESVNVTVDHLARLFRAAAAVSPTEYYQRRRAQRAAAELLDPRNSVTSVAHALGYADAAHLSRLFRRHHGLSPRQYRARFSAGGGGG
jgi:AraC-like DNA-binding protein